MTTGDDATTRAMIKWGEDAQQIADSINELLAQDDTAIVPHTIPVNPLVKSDVYGLAAALFALFTQREQPFRLHVDDPLALLQALHARDPTAQLPTFAPVDWDVATLSRRPIVIRCSAETKLEAVSTPAHANEIPLVIWTCPVPVDA